MNRENLGCEIIKDLIPLCSEGLCSEESRTAIEKHVRDCEGCRRLYEQLPEIEEPKTSVPDESKTFRKVSKKLKRGKLKIMLLSVVLLVVCGGLGYLTYGQIVKPVWSEVQSFETLFQSVEVKRLAKLIADGDFEAYAEQTTIGDLYDSTADETERAALRKKQAEVITTAFETAYGDAEAELIKVESSYTLQYTDENHSNKIVYSIATIYFNDGKQMEVHFSKGADGLYGGSVFTNVGGAEAQFMKVFNYLERQDLYPRGWLDRVLTNEAPVTDREQAAGLTHFLVRYIGNEWCAGIEERMIDFYLKGYYVTDFDVTPVLYDKEKKMLYHEVTFGARDEKGSCILMTRLYADVDGLMPAPETNKIFENGCTDELASDMDELFG